MSYIPSTKSQQLEMLKSMGMESFDELLSSIPEELKLKRALDIPGAKTEFEVIDEISAMAQKNKVFKTCFRGAGAYKHYIPSVVNHITSREEFVTAYTPYQAEMSQGVLQTIFEYQTTICELTGMEVSNAGVYDGAQAAAEAIAMYKDRKRQKAIVFDNIKPMTLETIKTYCNSAGSELVIIKSKNGVADIQALEAALDNGTACVYMEQPNCYGIIDDAEKIASLTHSAKAKLIMGCDPIACAVMKTPAEYGADAAVGEGQQLGMPLSFGGPYLGFMAVMNSDMRKLPGRIVGQTSDEKGNTAYVLTLQAREQHIRREKASSSICSNEALCSLIATVYCAAMGKQGMKEVANQCFSKAHYLAEKVSSVKGFEMKYDGFFFDEFVTKCPTDAQKLNSMLADNGILGPLAIEADGEKCLLWCATEVNTEEEIDKICKLISEVAE